jgi:hypothetical protein
MRKVVRKSILKKNILKSQRGALDISFGLIFAILAGIFILALAIFAATKLKGIETFTKEGETSMTIGILTNPLESSFESAKRVVIISPARMRIYNSCETDETFGNQVIETSQLTYGTWAEPELKNKLQNRYMFSENPVESKKFYIFSEPFELPFKIGDLMYITSSEKAYCFMDASNEVEKDLKAINQANIFLDYEGCPEGSIKICFLNSPDCDIKVNYNSGSGYVIKDSKRMYFEGNALMYAAILSDQKEYECQVKRLINRTIILNEIYLHKNNRMSGDLSCGTEINNNLILFNDALGDFTNSKDLSYVKEIAEGLDTQNTYTGCPLW